MYQWAVTCLRTPPATSITTMSTLMRSINLTIWSYNQGVMVGAGVLLYELTGTSTYLEPSRADGVGSPCLLRDGPDPCPTRDPAFNAASTFAICCS